jgi:PAS domain S-box-containing protein
VEVRARLHDLTVVTFPADDAVFAERVHELVEGSLAADDDVASALETRLRRIHPRVGTSFRESMAGFGDQVLYVFRDGTPLSKFGDERWVHQPDTARVVTDPSGRYVDANPAAEELFGVSREEILSARAGTFTRPDDRIENADALWRALAKHGRLHSLAVVTCPDGTEESVEFITVLDGDGPGRNVTTLRFAAASHSVGSGGSNGPRGGGPAVG